MTPSDLFQDIIQSVDPDEVPLEFVVLAKITDLNGNERIIRGAELERVMKGPERRKLTEARIILNVRKIRESISFGVNEIYDEINRRITDDIRNPKPSIEDHKNKDI